MGLCSGKLGENRPEDVLGSTNWAREVLKEVLKRKQRGSLIVDPSS